MGTENRKVIAKSSSTEPKSKNRLLTQESFDRLRKKANDGDPAALKMLRRYMDDHPEIWKQVGDLAKLAQEAFIAKASEGDQLVAESIRRKGEEMKRDLLGPRPTTAQKLAAERVVACWLESSHLDRLYPEPSGTIKQASFTLRLRESAQKRLDRALKSLATLQKLQGEGGSARNDTKKRRKAPPVEPGNRLRMYLDDGAEEPELAST
jgi:hypothetical protein